MAKLIIRSLVYGFIIGSILFAIAPLGLGIYFIELLKPLLVPGVLLTQFILGNTVGSKPILLALFLNGMIYSIPFLAFSLIQRERETKTFNTK